MLCCMMLYSVVSCRVVLCCVVLCCHALCCVVFYVVLHSSALYSLVVHGAVSIRVVLCCFVLHGMCRELHCIGLGYVVLFSWFTLQRFALSSSLLYKMVL